MVSFPYRYPGHELDRFLEGHAPDALRRGSGLFYVSKVFLPYSTLHHLADNGKKHPRNWYFTSIMVG